MNANLTNLNDRINTQIRRLSPSWFVTPEILRDVAGVSVDLANEAIALGFSGQWLIEPAQSILAGGYLRPATESDHLCARLAGLSVDIVARSQRQISAVS